VLYSLRARYYNSTQRQSLSRDTAGYNFEKPVELNRYGYVAGNPVNRYDPSGHLLAETEMQYSKDAESEESEKREGHRVRNMIGAIAYSIVAFMVYEDALQRFNELPYWLRELDDAQGCLTSGKRARATIAFTVLDWTVWDRPWLTPVAAVRLKKATECLVFKAEVFAVLLGMGGFAFDAGWGVGKIHAERYLYDRYQGLEPEPALDGPFYAIGVSNLTGACGGDTDSCQTYFIDVGWDWIFNGQMATGAFSPF